MDAFSVIKKHSIFLIEIKIYVHIIVIWKQLKNSLWIIIEELTLSSQDLS